MFRALRSRVSALATLAAFLLAQPAAACAALCLLQGHAASVHAMSGMSGGSPAVADGPCHTSSAGAIQRDPFQALSPMAPTRAAVVAVAPDHRVEQVLLLPARPPFISHSVEPPPPRLV